MWEHITRLLSEPKLITEEIERPLEEIKSNHPNQGHKEQLQVKLEHPTKARIRIIEAYQERLIEPVIPMIRHYIT